MSKNLLADDLDHILLHTGSLWEDLRDQRIFIAGGTGFFGCWLLESLAWANDRQNLNVKALVLSRNPEGFAKKAPHLYHHRTIQFWKGDIKDFMFPEGQFAYLIHTAIHQQPADRNPSNLALTNEMLSGTKRLLDFCLQAGVNKMLLVSTGAVYGQIPPGLEKIPEDFTGSFDPASSASGYHHVRRMMESLTALYAKEHHFEAKIARGFAFIGPYLPLNGRFAAGDFIMDAVSGRPLTVKGDGKAVRSYLYMADLAIWLWTILLKGNNRRPYNVGSEDPTTILALAEEIAHRCSPPLPVLVSGHSSPGVAPNHYVPDTTRAQTEIGLRQTISIADAVTKTLQWHKNRAVTKEAISL